MSEGNGQRPGRRNPAGRSCSALLAAVAVFLAAVAWAWAVTW